MSLFTPMRMDLARWLGSEGSVTLAATDSAYEQLPPYARSRFVLVSGMLWKATARCIYRRDEVVAWALLQLLERYPGLPDFDVVLNCRDGPLLRLPRRGLWKGQPLVLSFSAMSEHAEVAMPDYTFWGLPGKLKPWSVLRVELLHRAQKPWRRRLSRAIATGVVNDYHSTLGVQTRQALAACAARPGADKRLVIHYHSLYFARYYSTEEHCAYKYIILAPGSHAVWLDHMKHKLLCGSLVMLLEPAHPAPRTVQYDILTRLLRPSVHYLSVKLPPLAPPSKAASSKAGAVEERPERTVCDLLVDAINWAEANPETAQKIALAGRALVRDVLTMDHVYAYFAELLNASSTLLGYRPVQAMQAHRMIADPNPKRGSQWFNASNFSRVPTDPDEFVRWIRNDTSYPAHAQIREADFEAVLLRHDFSRMGLDFATSARRHRAQIEEMRNHQKTSDETRRSAEDEGRRVVAAAVERERPRSGRRNRRRAAIRAAAVATSGIAGPHTP